MGSVAEPKRAPERLAILPLRNSVLFPMSVVPINVGRPRSVRLVEDLLGQERALVGVVTQRLPDTVEPTFGDLHAVGTLARVVKVIRLGQSNYSVVLNGLGRFRIEAPAGLEPYMRAEIERLREGRGDEGKVAELAATLRNQTRRMLELLPDLPKETSGILDNVREPGALADLIASNFPDDHASIEDRQRILEAVDLEERLERVLSVVLRQLEILTAKDRIAEQIREEMTRSQHEYVLRQQMSSILEELGDSADEDELGELRARIARADLPPEADAAARKQLSRLRSMQPQSAEFNVARNYVEILADLPWNRTTVDHVEVSAVRRCLDEDHYGLEKVKRRIVEYTAVRQLRADKRGPILLFVGPPGVGKTSLGRSIARAMGRRYGRISLGGVRDEAEIRGHRRTYVGALPGRVIQALRKVGTRNPVLVLDEVDKMGADVRGDPAAALLEVLDPEQNATFVDHYVDLPFDLSQVTFIATANDRNGIPGPLEDRMEIIEVPGYTRSDKLKIAEQFLVPKQLREHGVSEDQLTFERTGIEALIDHYTREAGVRNLERAIASVCRHVAVQLAEGKPVDGHVADRAYVEAVLGVHRYRPELAERKVTPGVATGLSVGPAGGDLLFIETTLMPGTGKVHVTGNMKAIMKESAATAVSYMRSRADRLGLDPNWIEKVDLHLHVPRAGGKQDVASAGLAMLTSVASLLLETPARPEVALTGEVTLRGSLLPIDGLKEKILAAHRAGIREIVFPERNTRDLEDVPEEILADLVLHPARNVHEALNAALEGGLGTRGKRAHSSDPPAGEMHP
jgi:ATP-dependent Lon protease